MIYHKFINLYIDLNKDHFEKIRNFLEIKLVFRIKCFSFEYKLYFIIIFIIFF